MRALALCLVLPLALAGCSSGGGLFAYLPDSGLPGDLRLLDEDDRMWQEMGARAPGSNPGRIEPDEFGIQPGGTQGPQPEEAWVAIYVLEEQESAMIMGFAGRFDDASEALPALGGDCADGAEAGEDFGLRFRLLRDGDVVVLFANLGGGPELMDHVDDLADRVRRDTGATDVC